jgi:hypothetical protein
MTSIEGTVDNIHNTHANRDAVVTFTTNGTHSPNSLHYSGNAVDLRTRDLTQAQINNIVENLQEQLGDDYDVIFEGDHIHIEYDPPDQQEQNNQQNQQDQSNDGDQRDQDRDG